MSSQSSPVTYSLRLQETHTEKITQNKSQLIKTNHNSISEQKRGPLKYKLYTGFTELVSFVSLMLRVGSDLQKAFSGIRGQFDGELHENRGRKLIDDMRGYRVRKLMILAYKGQTGLFYMIKRKNPKQLIK